MNSVFSLNEAASSLEIKTTVYMNSYYGEKFCGFHSLMRTAEVLT